MKTIKTTVMALAALAAMVGQAGESAEFRLDTMDGPRTARAVETIAYSAAWNNGYAVVVAVGGVAIKEAFMESGDVVWDAALATPGTHTLTHGCDGETLTAVFEVKKENPVVVINFRKEDSEWDPRCDKAYWTCEERGGFAVFSGVEEAMPVGTYTLEFHSGETEFADPEPIQITVDGTKGRIEQDVVIKRKKVSFRCIFYNQADRDSGGYAGGERMPDGCGVLCARNRSRESERRPEDHELQDEGRKADHHAQPH